MGGVKRLRKRREIREARKTRGVTRGDPKSEPYARGYVQEIGFGHIEALLTRALWSDKRGYEESHDEVASPIPQQMSEQATIQQVGRAGAGRGEAHGMYIVLNPHAVGGWLESRDPPIRGPRPGRRTMARAGPASGGHTNNHTHGCRHTLQTPSKLVGNSSS
ncbi:hypothetical protein RRG08_039247 [Elysia crispata]|uniref:Uncharacterized protein n=1 Tax=Elysia crispata TaxID=231223 RepID=A0AAE1BFB9_9GAST|nr:hypothetical protein RRG08_039247 [Elysia crispata]